MTHVLLIGIGGFAGAISRYLISRYLNNLISIFPLGTLTVNVAGSFVLGFVGKLEKRVSLPLRCINT